MIVKRRTSVIKPTADAATKGAKSETMSDGQIFVMPVADCVRIGIGEQGNKTIG